MSNKLLCIAIPTYRRLHHLKRVLDSLCDEVQGLEDVIEIFVSDNHSCDGTAEYLQALSIKFKFLSFISNPENLGPDENFRLCFVNSNAKYFWLLGDDDFPKKGFLSELIYFINNKKNIDIIYLNSHWVVDIDLAMHSRVDDLSYKLMTKYSFAEYVNIWLGYISAVIIKKDLIEFSDQELLQQLKGSNLIQLGWVLPALKKGKNFFVINTKCILATRNNTGGYAAIDIFGVRLPRILKSYLAEDVLLQRKVLEPMILSFFTALVWKIRNQSDEGVFLNNHNWENVKQNLNNIWAFRLLTKPAYSLPKNWGIFFVLLAKIIGYLRKKTLLWIGYEFI